MKENLLIISNDKFYFDKNKIFSFSHNFDTIISSFKLKYKIKILARKSNKKLNSLQNIKICSFINFKDLFNFFKEKIKYKVFFISITPYNFLIYLTLNIFFKKKIIPIVFLRSDGIKEYFYKYSFFGYFVYKVMLKFFENNGAKFITCGENISELNKKKIVFPSELDSSWIKKKNKRIQTNYLKLLYIGRFRKEKGFYSLIKILKKINVNYKITFVGKDINFNKRLGNNKKKFIYKDFINSEKKLKKIYDSSDLMILPSFTEGFPMVILESFSRLRPVIIFKEISFLKKYYKKSIICCKRNSYDLKKKLEYISENYDKIQKNIYSYRNLVTKENYQKSLLKHLESFKLGS